MQTEIHLQVNDIDGNPTEELKRIVVVVQGGSVYKDMTFRAFDLTHKNKEGIPWLECADALIINKQVIPYSERIENTVDERFNAYVVKGSTVAVFLDSLERGNWRLNDCNPALASRWKSGKHFSNNQTAMA